MRFTMKTSVRCLALLCLFAFVPALTRADDAAKPVPVMVTAVKSLDAAGKMIKDLGVDVPPFLTAAWIEQNLPFIGPGGLDMDKPIGIVMFGAPGLAMDKAIVIVFPVKATAATPDALKALGGQPMLGHPDTFVIGNALALRRTANALVMSGNLELAPLTDVDAVADAVKDPATLARITADMKALRQSMPDLLPKLMEKSLEGKEGADRQGAEMFFNGLKQFYGTVDRVDLSLHVGEQGARVSLAISPMPVPAPFAAKRAAMPAEIIGRVDLGVSGREAFPGMDNLVTQFVEAMLKNPGQTHTEEEKKQIVALMKRMVALEVDPAATSIGVSLAEGKPAVYIAQHWSKPVDVAAEFRDITAAMMKLKKPDNGNDIEWQTYEVNGEKVSRLAMKEQGKIGGHFDIMQKETDVLIEFGPGEAHNIERLYSAVKSGVGPESGVLSAWVDLGKLFDQAGKLPDSKLADLPPELQKQIAELVANQKVHLELSKVGDGISVDVKISRALLENIPKLVAIFKPK